MGANFYFKKNIFSFTKTGQIFRSLKPFRHLTLYRPNINRNLKRNFIIQLKQSKGKFGNFLEKQKI